MIPPSAAKIGALLAVANMVLGLVADAITSRDSLWFGQAFGLVWAYWLAGAALYAAVGVTLYRSWRP